MADFSLEVVERNLYHLSLIHICSVKNLTTYSAPAENYSSGAEARSAVSIRPDSMSKAMLKYNSVNKGTPVIQHRKFPVDATRSYIMLRRLD